MKKTFAAIASFAAFTSFPAFAQAASDTDTEALAAAKQMLIATNAREMTLESWRVSEDAWVQQLRPSVIQALQGKAGITAAQKRQALDNYDKTLPATVAKVHALFQDAALLDELMDAHARLYANMYTADELRQVTEFYQSPVGRKFTAGMSQQIRQTMEINIRVVMTRVQKLVDEIVQNVVTQ